MATDEIDTITISKLSDALADPDSVLIYREAKLQYDALLQFGKDQDIDLKLFYRNLFESATKELEDYQRFKLLHLCFAYKRRWMVLRFLDDLDEKVFEWVRPLRKVIKERGRDTLFDSASVEGGEEEESGHRSRPQAPRLSQVHQTSYVTNTGTFDSERVEQEITPTTTQTPTKPKEPYFIIPTLSLAYPTQFFTAYASQVTLTHLTVPHLLSCPAILLVSLSPCLWPTLQSRIRQDWEQMKVDAQDAEAWTCFFEHLLQNEAKLFDNCFRRPVLGPDVRAAYDGDDLDMWLKKWFANRQMDGLKERGVEARRQIMAGRMAVDGLDDVEPTEKGKGGAETSAKSNRIAAFRTNTRVTWCF